MPRSVRSPATADLVIVTLAGGVAITEFVFKNPTFVGDASTGGAKVPNPMLFGWDFGLVLNRGQCRRHGESDDAGDGNT